MTLITSLKVLFPSIVILGVRTSPHEFGGGGGEDTVQTNTALIFPISMRTYKLLSPPIFRRFLGGGGRIRRGKGSFDVERRDG